MFSNILVPLDGSRLAEQALTPASKIADALNAKITLLRAVPQYPLLAADPTLYEEMNRMGEDEALSYLRLTAEEMCIGLAVNVAVQSGHPEEVIIRYAETHDVNLIVMSSHGRSGISRWVYGSVAERVLRRATCTTAILNMRTARSEHENKNILVPLDGSDVAERAIMPGKTLAQAFGAKLHFLRVIPIAHQVFETDSMRPVFEGIEEKELNEAEVYLLEHEMIKGEPSIVTKVEIEKGAIAENIIQYAAQQDIGMIVMSSHGYSVIKRWVFGSVAEKVLRSACCTTMIVRD